MSNTIQGSYPADSKQLTYFVQRQFFFQVITSLSFIRKKKYYQEYITKI